MWWWIGDRVRIVQETWRQVASVPSVSGLSRRRNGKAGPGRKLHRICGNFNSIGYCTQHHDWMFSLQDPSICSLKSIITRMRRNVLWRQHSAKLSGSLFTWEYQSPVFTKKSSIESEYPKSPRWDDHSITWPLNCLAGLYGLTHSDCRSNGKVTRPISSLVLSTTTTRAWTLGACRTDSVCNSFTLLFSC